MVLVRWEKQEKAPAAKRLDSGCNEWSDSGTGCGHWPSFREPTCEWSKGGGQRARGTRAVDGTCRSEGMACVFAFSGKNHDSPERTTRGYRFNSQSEAEANKTKSAEARSDPQASQTRQPVDF